MIDIATDIGGTFTDIALLEDGKRLYGLKVPSTPRKPVLGVKQGMEKILQNTGHTCDEVRGVLHGSTVATNAIIEQKGARLGILMTKGFEDVLEIGRQQRAALYDLSIDVQTPVFLAPRRRRMGITERIAASGEVVTKLDEHDVRRAVAALIEEHGAEAIAVCYLFSFLNPVHEIRTREIIESEFPGTGVSLSSKLSPIFREYERLCVTAFDAYVRPIVGGYVEQLEHGLAELGIKRHTYIIQSSGGLATARAAAEKPVNMILSGPAGGVMGGKFVANLANFKNVITIDMGGTSFDVALVREGKPIISREGRVCNYPLRVPMVDVNTIGAGGGSIAWLDAANGLHVGPQSAGSEPGPACYGLGGEEATDTDASVVLGYLNPDYFAGGELRLEKAASVKAIERIAERLGMDVPSTAFGIHRVLNSKMADEIRLITIRRGYDPREFAIVAMGGAGPVHAGVLAQSLEIPTIIVPELPGVLSAFGLLVANLECEQSTTFPMKLHEFDFVKANELLVELDRLGKEEMERDGIPFNQVSILRLADMRYVGQSFELEVPIPERIDSKSIVQIEQNFAEVNNRIYGQVKTGVPIEFVNFRSLYIHAMPQPDVLSTARAGSIEEALKGRREAYFGNGYISTPIYDRTKLPVGGKIEGPAIIEQADTTTVIYPKQSCHIDDFNNIIINALGG
ncbi:hydantoinase/oxoprolinase family protein [Chloroflexota bacterium]